jgi:O-antigen/teichoic acid export membrane protein
LVNSMFLSRRPHRDVRSVATRDHVREWLFSTPAMMIVSSFTQYQAQVIVIFVGLFLDVRSAGIFALATRLSNVIQIVVQGVNQPALPRLAQAFARDDNAALNRISGLAATACLLVVLPVVAGVVLLGPFLLSFLEPGYAITYVPLTILCLGLLVQSAFSPVVVLLGITGKQNVAGAVFIASLLLCLGVLALLGRMLSVQLVAVVAALLGAIAFATLARLAYKLLGVRCWARPSLLYSRT